VSSLRRIAIRGAPAASASRSKVAPSVVAADSGEIARGCQRAPAPRFEYARAPNPETIMRTRAPTWIALLCVLALPAAADAKKPKPGPPTKTATGATTATTAAPTARSAPIHPNVYQLKSGTLSVTYTIVGSDGQPHFLYHDVNTHLDVAGPDEIRTQETENGTLVSVTLRRTIDTGSTSFSLLVPQVNLENADAVATVNVVALTTVHRFSPVPAFNVGQVQLVTADVLNGTAKLVKY
jgi:hypothetical protein